MAGGLRVQSQPRLYSKNLHKQTNIFPNKNKDDNNKDKEKRENPNQREHGDLAAYHLTQLFASPFPQKGIFDSC